MKILHHKPPRTIPRSPNLKFMHRPSRLRRRHLFLKPQQRRRLDRLEKGLITRFDMSCKDIPCRYQRWSLVLMGSCLLLVVSFLCPFSLYSTLVLSNVSISYLLCIWAGAEKVVKIWSPETGEFLRNLSGHTQGLSDIAWSSDSVYLASASDDTTIRIWDVETVCFSPTYFSCAIKTLKRCSQKKGLTHKLLKGHTKWVFCLNYNTASNFLVSGGCDGDVRIWNTAKGLYFSFFEAIFVFVHGPLMFW